LDERKTISSVETCVSRVSFSQSLLKARSKLSKTPENQDIQLVRSCAICPQRLSFGAAEERKSRLECVYVLGSSDLGPHLFNNSVCPRAGVCSFVNARASVKFSAVFV